MLSVAPIENIETPFFFLKQTASEKERSYAWSVTRGRVDPHRIQE